MWCTWPQTSSRCVVNACNRIRADTAAAPGDPLYGIRRPLLTRIGLLTDKQKTRITNGLEAREEHLAVAVTYAVYQD